MYTHANVHIYKCIHTCTNTLIHIYTHARTHTYTHTHTSLIPSHRFWKCLPKGDGVLYFGLFCLWSIYIQLRAAGKAKKRDSHG